MNLKKALKTFNPNSFKIDDVLKLCDKYMQQIEKERCDEEEAERLNAYVNASFDDYTLISEEDYRENQAFYKDTEHLKAVLVGVELVDGPIIVKYEL